MAFLCIACMENRKRGDKLSSGLKSKIVGRHIKAKFASFWLQQINAEKPGPDGLDHNKVRTYKKLKGFFDIEPFPKFSLKQEPQQAV